MIVLLKMLYAFSVGLAGHQTNGMFNEWDDRGRGAWVLLGRYAVGTMLLTISIVPFIPHRHRERAVLILLGVSACTGAGVAAGYAIDEVMADYEQINNIDI